MLKASTALKSAPVAPVSGANGLGPRDMLPWLRAAYTGGEHSLAGYDQFLETGVAEIMVSQFAINRRIVNTGTANPDIEEFRVGINFSDVVISRPRTVEYLVGQPRDLWPSEARTTGHSYSGALTATVRVTLQAIGRDGRVDDRSVTISNVAIGSLPIMVGCKLCHTYGATRDQLKLMGEDPRCIGGYFIVSRGEYAVCLGEQIRYNSPHIHVGIRKTEVVRAEFLSQPGGAFANSSQSRVRLTAAGQITVEFNSQKLSKAHLPWFMLYRLFGMTSDRDVVETVVFDADAGDELTRRQLDILYAAFHAVDPAYAAFAHERDPARLADAAAEKLAKYVTNNSGYAAAPGAEAAPAAAALTGPELVAALDNFLLPHMGRGPEARRRKLCFLGLLISRMLLVHLGVMPPTDRDSYQNKRLHGAGVSLAKAFKTHFTAFVVRPTSSALRRELLNNPWAALREEAVVNIFSGNRSGDLIMALERSITAGDRGTVTVRDRSSTNRVKGLMFERKSELNTICTVRAVLSENTGNAAKSTSRAEEMRMPHPTAIGGICPSHSPDTGERVGMNKQLALTAGVCTAGDGAPLRRRLLAEPTVTALDFLRYGPRRAGATAQDDPRRGRIFLNGEWLGCCADPAALAARYRAARRAGELDPHCTIYVDPILNEVEFWLDVGRLVRPLLIVENNLEAYDAAQRAGAPIPFVQRMRFTAAHVRRLLSGTATVTDLVAEGVAEYITAEEQLNCLIAPNVEALDAAANNVTLRYTHVEVEQAIFGLATLVSPFANHTQPARVTYETNQGRQTGGWYSLAHPYRVGDKERFFQYYCQTQLIDTVTSSIVRSGCMNVQIAYASYLGDNQEDSAIVSGAAVDRDLFNGAYFRAEIIEREKGDEFAAPNRLTTKNIKPGANYEMLEPNGLIREGSIVRQGDVLVGRVAKIARAARAADEPWLYTDRSVVYSGTEPALVERVLSPRGPNDEVFVVIRLAYERPLRTGDKMSSRSGNKSICAAVLPQSDMPYDETGASPDIIVNPHCLPTRMTVGQLVEALAIVAARRGTQYDCTAFLPVEHYAIATALYDAGLRYNGRRRLYDGRTGEHMDAAIFMAPTGQQRLLKFVLNDEQSVGSNSQTDATTGQPMRGRDHGGGLKLGEMENWGLESHGSMYSLQEKCSGDSDGRAWHICRGCGAPAVFNAKRGIYGCQICGELADIETVASCKTAQVFHEELAGSNIRMQLGLQPRTYEVRQE